MNNLNNKKIIILTEIKYYLIHFKLKEINKFSYYYIM